MDLSETIAPRSDQLNADDLMGGPRTVTVVGVRGGDAEQPVSIDLEGYRGRPYKPGLSMRRLLVQAWGKDGAAYAGRRMTLYRDPSIRFGRDEVGGIRISHMSDLPGGRPLTVALTVTRGQRKPFTVAPLAAATPTSEPAPPAGSPSLLDQLSAAVKAAGWGKERVEALIDRRLSAFTDLTEAEAQACLDALAAEQTPSDQGPDDASSQVSPGEQATVEDPPFDADEDHARAVEASS